MIKYIKRLILRQEIEMSQTSRYLIYIVLHAEQIREAHAVLIHHSVVPRSLAPCKLNMSGSQCYHSIACYGLAKDEAFRMSSIRNVTMVKALFCFHLIGL